MTKRGPKPRPLAERFWPKVDVRGDDECWPWLGYIDPRGYGQMGREWAHRVAHALGVGPIPDGMEVDHVRERGCVRRDCCNPSHLQAVSHRVNVQRGERATRTHCVHGHAYTPENTIRRADGRRRCRTCANAARKRYPSYRQPEVRGLL